VSRVYSAQLCHASGLGGGVPTVLGVVPTGKVWVVRHMSATYTTVGTHVGRGFTVSVNNSFPIWTLGGVGIQLETAYTGSGRQVLNAGDELVFTSADVQDPGWIFFASGYELTTP